MQKTVRYDDILQRGLSYAIFFHVQLVWINQNYHRERGLDGRGHF